MFATDQGLTNEAYLPAEPPRAQASSRLPQPHGYRWRSQGFACASRTWPQVALGLSRDCLATDRIVAIPKRADFLRANSGLRAPMPGFVLLARDRGDQAPAIRLGLTVTKKIGNAVVRNRMRRRFRALGQLILPELGRSGHDYVLIGRAGGSERDYALLEQELRKALRKVSR